MSKINELELELLEHYDTVLQYLEGGHNVDVIYLDVANSFDKFNIEIVLAKIKALGINGQLYAFIKVFLMEREQAVCINGHFSKFPPVQPVPQGSVLGPFADDSHTSKQI